MDAVKFDYEQFAHNMKIEETDIGGAVTDNAGFLGFYGYQQGKWEAQQSLFKLMLKTREAEVARDIRVSASGKPPAQGVIDAEVQLDEQVQSLSRKLIIAAEQATLYTNAVKTFQDRGNNARSKNTTLREERKNI